VSIITLTTDFGAADWFVGTLKGVILGLQPRVQIVDITHDIPAGKIRAGAFALAASYKFFPKHTIHVAVVDPGVGSRRRAIAVRTARYVFVGPDNGVLWFALARERIRAIHQITNERLFFHPPSNTFHGRDVFAPVAACLSKGMPIQKVGPATKACVRLAWPEPECSADSIAGEVVYLDRFGNAITNIDSDAVAAIGPAVGEVVVRNKRVCSLNSFYTAVPPGKAVALVGSCGLLEIAVSGGSAAHRLGLQVGNRVVVRRRKPGPSQ